MLSFSKSLKWILAVPLLFLGAWWLIEQRVSTSPNFLPILAELPKFQFTNHEGKPVSQRDLSGKVVVINFIFTQCPTVCPLLTQKMQVLTQKISDPGVLFVSISVDPANDTPEVLRKYRQEFGVNDGRWTFLTGPIEQITDVVIKGFKVALIREKKPEKADSVTDLFDITHGEHFVLVDKKEKIRAYRMLESSEDERVLLQAVETLLLEN